MTTDFEVHPTGTAAQIDRLRKAAIALRADMRTRGPRSTVLEFTGSDAWREFCAAADDSVSRAGNTNPMGANDADPA